MSNPNTSAFQKVVSVEYFPEAKRTDGDTWIVGDTTIVTLACGHRYHGSYGTKIGTRQICRQCQGLTT